LRTVNCGTWSKSSSVICVEIPKQTTGSLYLPMESSGQTTILRAESADRTATVVFEGEEPTTEIAEWRTPDTQNQDDLEEIWRIAPRDLQCKLNSCGELIKLGIGTHIPHHSPLLKY
jgi:hypothetical protein